MQKTHAEQNIISRGGNVNSFFTKKNMISTPDIAQELRSHL